MSLGRQLGLFFAFGVGIIGGQVIIRKLFFSGSGSKKQENYNTQQPSKPIQIHQNKNIQQNNSQSTNDIKYT